MQTEDLKESSKQTTAEETPQQEAQTNTADAANGVDETAGKKSEGAAEEKTPVLSWGLHWCLARILVLP